MKSPIQIILGYEAMLEWAINGLTIHKKHKIKGTCKYVVTGDKIWGQKS